MIHYHEDDNLCACCKDVAHQYVDVHTDFAVPVSSVGVVTFEK